MSGAGAGRVAIVGAGVAGMTAAIHARASGFEVDVYERHTVPGGLCTSWRRDGFLFDGCVEFFVGSAPSSPFYPLWQEVGVVPRPFVDRPTYSRTALPGGEVVLLHADPEALRAHLLEVAPGDARPIDELCELVRLMRRARYRVDLAPELMGLKDKVGVVLDALSAWKLWAGATRTTIRAFAGRFRSPAVRAALTSAIPDGLPLLALVQVLGDMANGAAGSPLGGSLQVALDMAARCRALGVRLHLGAEVDGVELERGRATGLRLAGGERVEAEVVIAAGDLRHTLDVLLGGAFPSPRHEALYRRPTVPAVCLVSCGLRAPAPCSGEVVVHRHLLQPPREVAGHRLEVLAWKTFVHDPTLARAPRTVVSFTVPTEPGRWEALAGDRAGYDAARAALGEGVVALAEEAMPGFGQLVEAVDVATPLTVTWYTLNHRGHYMTFLPEPGPPRVVPRTLPGLQGLYLAGMWVKPPGGLPNALMSGREVVQVLCAERKVPFRPAPRS